MDKFKGMTAFVAIVEQGSLSAAAEQLNRSAATMVRTLAELEEYLGVRLLNRSTRRLSLTDEGREYLQHCRRILAEVQEVEFLLDSRKQRPAGKLSLTAPVMFGRLHIAPLLNQWLLDNPGMSAELTLLDRVTDIIEEGYDIALRIGKLSDSSLIAMPLGQVHYTLCASPQLVEKMSVAESVKGNEKIGLLEHPCELANWPVIAFAPQGQYWQLYYQGNPIVVPITPVFTSNQIDPVLNAVKAGLGVAMVVSYQAREGLESGELVSLLDDCMPEAIPVQFVYPHNRLLSPRVRLFLDWAAPRIRQILG
ncbi:LysR family transcriptional regulator [Oceanospirillum beijerinckii]|uniref:LysR family transcriptional regulator n=1 Tax=Oceanospirillum beijerinckii TaxID=64976 RepID=UPI00041B8ED8|nr:LysR family transcriptional regulator [Oceanospirillum beijerinckii]